MNLKFLKQRGRQALPSLFTIGNMAFGFFAILAASDGSFYAAGWFLIGGGICDMLDGRVARIVNAESDFGAEFDSMADFCAFGVAPAFIMYEFILKDFGGWGYPVAFLFALCAGLRLARFNLAAVHGEASSTEFQGLPSPAAAGILASFLLVYTIFEQGRPVRTLDFVLNQMPQVYMVIPFVMIAISLLMVSSVPYTAFKGKGVRPKSVQGLLLKVLVLSLIYMYPESSLFLFFSGYVVSGLLVGSWRLATGKKLHD